MSFIWAFGNIESKHTLYREEDCMKMFCNSLREHATNCNWFWKKENVSINKKELKLHQIATECVEKDATFVEKDS